MCWNGHFYRSLMECRYKWQNVQYNYSLYTYKINKLFLNQLIESFFEADSEYGIRFSVARLLVFNL